MVTVMSLIVAESPICRLSDSTGVSSFCSLFASTSSSSFFSLSVMEDSSLISKSSSVSEQAAQNSIDVTLPKSKNFFNLFPPSL